MHMNRGKWHDILYRDDELGIQKEIHTKFKNELTPIKEYKYYFIDNDAREFKTEDEMLQALCGKR